MLSCSKREPYPRRLMSTESPLVPLVPQRQHSTDQTGKRTTRSLFTSHRLHKRIEKFEGCQRNKIRNAFSGTLPLDIRSHVESPDDAHSRSMPPLIARANRLPKLRINRCYSVNSFQQYAILGPEI